MEADGKTLKIGAVGMITTAEMARSIVQDGKLAGQAAETVEVQSDVGNAKADLVLVARQFLRGARVRPQDSSAAERGCAVASAVRACRLAQERPDLMSGKGGISSRRWSIGSRMG